jgi:RNA polymerase sigma factor (sigma-70 family)
MATTTWTRPRTTRTPYEEHREYVLSVLARRCGWLDPSDREALFHDAYAVFLEKQREGQLDISAMRPPQVRAYLTQTSLNKAMDEGKRAGRRRSVSLDNEDLGIEPADPQRDIDERLAARYDDARVREIVAKLPERQQIVIKLRFFFNRTPQEIQHYMGITERVYRRELERASRTLAERFELVRDGTFCESQRSLMLAYVTGVAGPTRMAAARRHLDSCPSCTSWVLEMRSLTRRAGAAVPPPILGLSLHHWLLGRIAPAAHSARERVSALLSNARDQGMRTLVRSDPSRVVALGGARPGAVAAIVAGCLAAGSTATYCAVQGLPTPVRSLIGAPSHPHARHHADHRPQRAAVTTRTPSVPVTTTAASAATTAPSAGLQPPPPTHYVPVVSSSAAAHPPVHRATHASTTSGSSGRHASAAQVQRATNPEFGLGGGSATQTAATATAGSSAASQSTVNSADAASGSVSSSNNAGSSDSGSGSASPPAASKPMPEFDP